MGFQTNYCDLQDKILQSMGRGQEVTITNDGATILKSIYVDNPAAKVLVGKAGGCTWLSSIDVLAPGGAYPRGCYCGRLGPVRLCYH